MAGTKPQITAASQQLTGGKDLTVAGDSVISPYCPVEETDTERAARIAQLDVSELVANQKTLIKCLQSDLGGTLRGQASAKEFHELTSEMFTYSQRVQSFTAAVEAVKKPTAAAMEEARKRVPKASDSQAARINELENTVRDLCVHQERADEEKKAFAKQTASQASEIVSLSTSLANLKKTMEKEVQALRRESSRSADQIEKPMLRHRPVPWEASEERRQIQSRLLQMEDNQEKQRKQMLVVNARLEHCESESVSLRAKSDRLWEWRRGQDDFDDKLVHRIEKVEAWTPESSAYITDLAARIEEGEQRTTTLEAWSPEYDPHIMGLEARIEAGKLKSGLSSGPVMEDPANPPTQAATQSRGGRRQRKRVPKHSTEDQSHAARPSQRTARPGYATGEPLVHSVQWQERFNELRFSSYECR